MKKYYVYILKCSDNTYYTGITSDIVTRIGEHKNGKHKNGKHKNGKHKNGKHIDSYTYKRRPAQLVFTCEFSDVKMAIAKEKQIKKWSTTKKEALINGDFDSLPNLAKKFFVGE
jgi:putative endonuclease